MSHISSMVVFLGSQKASQQQQITTKKKGLRRKGKERNIA